MSDARTKVPTAVEMLKTPYPHPTPEEQAENERMLEMDAQLKDFGIEKTEPGK